MDGRTDERKLAALLFSLSVCLTLITCACVCSFHTYINFPLATIIWFDKSVPNALWLSRYNICMYESVWFFIHYICWWISNRMSSHRIDLCIAILHICFDVPNIMLAAIHVCLFVFIFGLHSFYIWTNHSTKTTQFQKTNLIYWSIQYQWNNYRLIHSVQQIPRMQ